MKIDNKNIRKLIKKLNNEGPATAEVLSLARKLEERLDLLDKM